MAGVDGRKPADDYACLVRELERYSETLAGKPRLVVGNKMDVPVASRNLAAFKRKHKVEVVPVSCLGRLGLEELKVRLRQRLQEM